jgi:hypothetical protein
MSDSRTSSAEGIWIGLCILLVILLSVAGAVAWLERRHASREMQAHAAAQDEISRLRERNAILENRMLLVEANRASLPLHSLRSRTALAPELHLNQDLWRHVESLEDAGPEDKVFTVDSETGEFRFGDGEHGARPPDGTVAIRVEYRMGREGKVTVFHPAADLQEYSLRAVRLPQGMLRLDVADPKADY